MKRKLIEMLFALTLLGIAGVRACQHQGLGNQLGNEPVVIESIDGQGFGVWAPKSK